MQEKINVILEAAKGWMTAGEIADKGGWRSAGNVGVCLKQMKDAESRKSPTRKQSNGIPAVEWKLFYKDFDDGDKNPIKKQAAGTTKESSAVEMPTDKECCNAAKVVATTAGAEVSELRQRITNLEQDREKQRVLLSSKQDEIEALQDDIRRQIKRAEDAERNRDDINEALDVAGKYNHNWRALAAEYECNSIPDLRAFIESLKGHLGSARIQIDALNEQLMADESIEAVGVEDVAKGYLVCAPKRKPMKLSKPESALAKATAAAKTTGRCEVFALVPVGVAVRKQVKAVEFKKANVA